MLQKKKLGINDAIEHTPIHSFEGADKKAQEHKDLKAGVTQQVNKGGRPLAGESKATEKVAFHIPKEVKDWLETLTGVGKRTPNAVIKEILMREYEIHGKKS